MNTWFWCPEKCTEISEFFCPEKFFYCAQACGKNLPLQQYWEDVCGHWTRQLVSHWSAAFISWHLCLPVYVSVCMSVYRYVCLYVCLDGEARSELDIMVCQVLNVLPHIPTDVIQQDLGMCVTWSSMYASRRKQGRLVCQLCHLELAVIDAIKHRHKTDL